MEYQKQAGTWFRYGMTGLGLAVLCFLFSIPVRAQLTEYKTMVTFSGAVEVPGSTPQVLPAGTYVFKILDSKVNRNIVQISNKDGTHVFTTILAVPTHRDEESDKTII